MHENLTSMQVKIQQGCMQKFRGKYAKI